MIIGIGVDLVEISRLRHILEQQGQRFIRRVYTKAEQEFCVARRDPAPHFAARFAAKEACFKALGTGWDKGVAWLDVEVIRLNDEAPAIELKGEAGRLSRKMGARGIHVSLTHSETTAAAVVIIEK